ncbi:MAG: hypothetical protein PHC66_04240 [Candidatus Nanoarchaeia archaeon]|nr:hypothetical protein [Candidatus Nanoarchaeia archaeon]MDD5239355.1 hypothetical protein [Candidatus Nanoarchaeia archaeon]
MKAQIISLDVMFAALIVLTIIGGLGVLLYQYTIYEKQQAELGDLELRSQPALNVLMSTKGNPDDWETKGCAQINSLGFMSAPGIISGQKLKAFASLDYNCSQALLGIRGYNFYFDARDADGNLLNIDGVSIITGYEPPAGSEAIFSERKAWVDSSYLAMITLGIWYE